VGAGAGVDVLENRLCCCCCQDLKPRTCSIYPVDCTDYAAPY
jgi:hypothetical protein